MSCHPSCECCKARCRNLRGCAYHCCEVVSPVKRDVIPKPPKIRSPLPTHAYFSQNARQRTFKDYLPASTSRALAKAGFYRIVNHPANVIKCPWCPIVVFESEYQSWFDPRMEHLSRSRRCPFMNNLPVGNVVPECKTIEEVLAKKYDYAGAYIGPDDYVII